VAFISLNESVQHAKRKPSPDFSGEGLVELSFSSYFLQHLPGQHCPLLLQQSTPGDDAVAVPMNVAKVAIKRRYFIGPPSQVWLRNSATNLGRAEPTVRKTGYAAVELADAECASSRVLR